MLATNSCYHLQSSSYRRNHGGVEDRHPGYDHRPPSITVEDKAELIVSQVLMPSTSTDPVYRIATPVFSVR